MTCCRHLEGGDKHFFVSFSDWDNKHFPIFSPPACHVGTDGRANSTYWILIQALLPCTLAVFLSREIFNDKEWFCNLQPFEIFSDHKLVTKSHLITYDQDTYDYQHDKNINKWYVDDMSCHSPVDCRHNRMEFNIPHQAGGSRPSRQC